MGLLGRTPVFQELILGRLLLWAFWLVALAGAAPVVAGERPVIGSLLKPAVLKKVTETRDIATHAELGDETAFGARHYSFYTAVLVHADPPRVRKVLTDFSLYAKLIPYVDKSDYSPSTRFLRIEGGIWKFRMMSTVKFDDAGENWLRYTIVGGHFTGLAGDIVFEKSGAASTLVYFRGDLTGTNWPPRFIIERGAEVIFEYAAKKMRAQIESPQTKEGEGNERPDRTEVPQPRRHL